jgi:hypothetical protein
MGDHSGQGSMGDHSGMGTMGNYSGQGTMGDHSGMPGGPDGHHDGPQGEHHDGPPIDPRSGKPFAESDLDKFQKYADECEATKGLLSEGSTQELVKEGFTRIQVEKLCKDGPDQGSGGQDGPTSKGSNNSGCTVGSAAYKAGTC